MVSNAYVCIYVYVHMCAHVYMCAYEDDHQIDAF